jgi:hypothetical protein
MNRDKLLELADRINAHGAVPPELATVVVGDVAAGVHRIFLDNPDFQRGALERGTRAAMLNLDLGLRSTGAVRTSTELEQMASGVASDRPRSWERPG